MSYPSRSSRRVRRHIPWFALVLPVIIGALLFAGFIDSFTYMRKAPETRPFLIYKGARQKYPVVVEEGEPYVSYTFIKEVMDPNVFKDDGLLVVTTQDKVVKLKTDSLTAYVNQNPVELSFPVILDGKEPYVPASTLCTLYPVATMFSPEAGTFIVSKTDESETQSIVTTKTVIREKPSLRARRVGDLEPGIGVTVYQSAGKWYRVETSHGLYGYVQAKYLDRLESVPPGPSQEKPQTLPKPPKGGKVSLVWEQVETHTADPSTIGVLPGINVVSPTWFRLAKTPGKVDNYAQRRYVDWAHSNGYQVWALFSNSFDLELTKEVLRDSALRDQVISQMLVYAEIYSLDGINLDFENVYQSDASYLTQFVREMTPLFHEQGLKVSMDVTVRSSSPTWSLCYERQRLAETLDYIMLMAYDQYGAGSSKAGPNASLPWTEWAIKTSLEEIPKEKLVLGIPFYSRLWKETTAGGKITVTQRALGMDAVSDWLRAENVPTRLDDATGMDYAQLESDEDTYRIWIENAESIRKRLLLADAHGLAGVAAWSRRFADRDTWEVMGQFLQQDWGG